MNVFISKNQVNGLRLNVSVSMQVVCVNLNLNVTLLDILDLIDRFFVFLARSFIISAAEDEALTITSWSDKHHMHDIFVVKGLVMRYLSNEVITDIVFAHAFMFVVLCEVIY